MRTGSPTDSRTQQGERHAARQWHYFKAADRARFQWQTGAPVFSGTERDLVSRAAGKGRLLEVGCGEGGNLFHLGPRNDPTVGVDYSMAKVAFASGVIPWARFVGGDATRLPFRPGAFDRILCRDLLHHLQGPAQREAVKEMLRVCRPGGEVLLIEPNGRNPLIGAFALLVSAERGMLRLTPARVCHLVEEWAQAIRLEMEQPLPVARLLLHYRFGMPMLGRRRLVAKMLSRLDAVLHFLVPRRFWAYSVLSAVAKRSEAEEP